MLIVVNTRLLIKDRLDGIGHFTYETLKRITPQHPEHEFIFAFDRPFSEEYIFSHNVSPVVVPPPARHPFLWYLWFEYSLPRLFKRVRPQIFLSTDGYISLQSKIKSVAVIHDINFEHYPTDLPFFYRNYYRHYFPKYAKQATRIATVSEFSKNDIAEKYSISKDKIDVVYNGANENFIPLNEQEKQQVRNRFSQGQPYFIFVGSLHARKNISNMLKAFDLFKKKESSPLKFIIAGSKRWWTSEMETALQNLQHKEDVLFTGRVNDNNLHLLTGAAYAAVYVSSFEGFGIPIIEAMNCDVPVLTSNITAMPEISGDAALLVDPFSVQSIADCMWSIWKDEALRNGLIAKGKLQRQKFSWDRTASLLWNTVEKVIMNNE